MALTTTVCSQTADVGEMLREASPPKSNLAKPNSSKPNTPPAAIGCVLLKNDHVLFGQARQLGEYVIVKSRHGGEIRLDREKVACWAPSIRNLYQFRVDHRRGGDLNAHLADARWCLRYDLFDLAATELRAAYAIDANNPEARRIEQQLDRRISEDTVVQKTNPVTASPQEVAPVQFESPVIDGAQQIEGRSLKHFAGQIQPMLVNRCSNCHSHRLADQTGVRWRIFAPPSGTRASAEFTRSNLEATLPYIDAGNPANSPLLTYATTKHGGVEAPLGLRNAKAIDGLQRWVALVANALNAEKVAPATVTQAPAPEPASVPAEQDKEVRATNQVEASDVASSGPARLPIVENPFDPDLFNRRFHMKTDGQP